MREQRATFQRRPASARRLGVLGVLLAALLGACGSNSSPTQTGVSREATSTETPSGDPLVIDGMPVVRVLIAGEPLGTQYRLTGDWLFVDDDGRWIRTPTGNDGRWMLVDPALPERLYRGDHPICGEPDEPAVPFEASADGGLTWTVRPSGENVRPLLVDPDLPDRLYGSDCGLAMSNDAGVTWLRLDPLPGFAVIDLAVDGTRLYVLGVSPDDQGRVRTIDLSDPLVPVAADVVLSAVGLRCIDAHDGRVVAGGTFGVQVSDDGGTTWSVSQTGLEAVKLDDPPPKATAVTPGVDIGVLTVEIAPEDKQRIFAGTSSGLYISQDHGATWVRYEEVPTSEPVSEVQFALGGADLYVTMLSGVVVVPSP